MTSKKGWNVVGASKYKGNSVNGTQVSYLLQHPDTLECYITFEGTWNGPDRMTDLAAFAVSFCGLTPKDEKCCTVAHGLCPGTCTPSRGSFVHEGFRNQLRRMT